MCARGHAAFMHVSSACTPWAGQQCGGRKVTFGGLAACPALGVVVTADNTTHTLTVWTPCGEGGLLRGRTLCAEDGPAAMHIILDNFAYLAFATTPPYELLVVDNSLHVVHVLDVVHDSHLGFLAPPGVMSEMYGLTAGNAGTRAQVAILTDMHLAKGAIHVYARDEASSPWAVIRVISSAPDFYLSGLVGLRFGPDGTTVCVANSTKTGESDQVCMFRISDGACVWSTAMTSQSPVDVEKVDGGWVVACWSTRTLRFLGDEPSDCGLVLPCADGLPVAMAYMPGLGLVVREYIFPSENRLRVYRTPHDLLMASMAEVRVAWITAVVRAVFRRDRLMASTRHVRKAPRKWYG